MKFFKITIFLLAFAGIALAGCGDDNSGSDYLACTIDGVRTTFNCGFTNESWPRTAWASKSTSDNSYMVIGIPTLTSLTGTPVSYLLFDFMVLTNSAGEFDGISSSYIDFRLNDTAYVIDSHVLLIYAPPGIGGTLTGSFNFTAHAGTTNIIVEDGVINVPRVADGVDPR